MATLRLRSIGFKAGLGTLSTPLEVDLTQCRVLVIVGPNNSGKSLALREIEAACTGSESPTKVVARVEALFPVDSQEVFELLEPFEVSGPPGLAPDPDSKFVVSWRAQGSEQPESKRVTLDSVKIALHHATKDRQYGLLFGLLVNRYTLRLDGRTRFELCQPKPTGDLNSPPGNLLAKLFMDDVKREKIRTLIRDAFGLHFVIDPTAMTQFRMRLSAKAPSGVEEEKCLDDRAIRFHQQAIPITESGDGVQAFAGLVSAVMGLPHRIILLDEPDAFLHPPLAKRLGQALAQETIRRDASLVTATHSADFLMGCLEFAADQATIVRLTYAGGATARALKISEVRDLMRDPLLRSTDTLDALFHASAVVTESDADRVFYTEVNRRLREANRGIEDAIFLNTGGWQPTARPAKMLRSMGVPTALILDLDTCTESAAWPAIYSAAGVSASARVSIEEQRRKCEGHLRSAEVRLKEEKPWKTQGRAILSGQGLEDLETLIAELKTYGVFLVEVGELERWMRSLGVECAKRDWLGRMLTRLGNDPGSRDYVRPSTGDIWQFLDQVGKWCADPQRLGM